MGEFCPEFVGEFENGDRALGVKRYRNFDHPRCPLTAAIWKRCEQVRRQLKVRTGTGERLTDLNFQVAATAPTIVQTHVQMRPDSGNYAFDTEEERGPRARRVHPEGRFRRVGSLCHGIRPCALNERRERIPGDWVLRERTWLKADSLKVRVHVNSQPLQVVEKFCCSRSIDPSCQVPKATMPTRRVSKLSRDLGFSMTLNAGMSV